MKSRGNAHIGTKWAAALIAGGLIMSAACSGNDKPKEPSRPEDASCQPLSEFDGFRYKVNYKIDTPKPEVPVDESAVGSPPYAIGPTAMSVTLQQIFDGAYRKPDRYMVNIDTPSETDTPPIELIFIGGRSFVNLGEWTETQQATNAFPPMGVCEATLAGLDLTGLTGNLEQIDGKPVTHFRRENAQLDAAATLFGAQSDMGRVVKTYGVDVWLAEEGWPVRLEAKGVGAYPSGREMRVDFSLEIKDVNSDDINIKPPI